MCRNRYVAKEVDCLNAKNGADAEARAESYRRHQEQQQRINVARSQVDRMSGMFLN